ncbi:cell division protein ZipA [Halomonas icarae]|uniref:Cell division protein ZipA n=1 Tax=Halomonas icarae TaxID=2691040 RepID=A0A7X4W0K9_9GAMM|nr:cell division protein ZipA [Halomonas icarae]MDR5900768.1 cell division protein ZipA [Halomonas icarae]NAW13764.1 cell division protein ZipA [Halomonas icarae]
MELREWLIILGLALVTLIVVDGVRRLQRQRRTPRLDEVAEDALGTDPDEAARKAEVNWELPNGGARVVRPADYGHVQPKPKLERQEHPGPSRVLSSWKASTSREGEAASESAEPMTSPASSFATQGDFHAEERLEPTLASLDDTSQDVSAPASDEGRAEFGPSHRSTEPLVADPQDHDSVDEDEHYRLVDFDGMGDSLKSGSKRMGSSVQRFGASLQKNLAERREQKRVDRARREEERKEEKARKLADEAERKRQAQAEAESARGAERRRLASEAEANEAAAVSAEEKAFEAPRHSDKVRVHPVLEKALRHDVSAEHARLTLSQSEEIIVISVMARDEEGFSGTALLDLMLACGLRYDREMGIFHRFETEDPESRLQFSMVNVVKPGTFPIEAIDDFRTPGITLLMPLPGAEDSGAAFEAMVETAMVIVRHLGGELKDEHQSVMTAQTVEFARQRVQDFVRRNRLHRYQVN